jgi:hypothetical protein
MFHKLYFKAFEEVFAFNNLLFATILYILYCRIKRENTSDNFNNQHVPKEQRLLITRDVFYRFFQVHVFIQRTRGSTFR